MRETILLFLTCWVGLTTLDRLASYDAARDIGFGAMAILALFLSSTFLWLWHVRATPLAAGMAFSWLGCACVIGSWWYYKQIGRLPSDGWEHDLRLLFVALYLSGGIMHLRVVAGAHWAVSYVIWLVLAATASLALFAAFSFG